MQSVSTLPIDLRLLSRHLRDRASAGLGMSSEECGRFAALIHLKAHDADKLVEQTSLMPELDDELHAVAFDLNRMAPAQPVCGYQAALKAQQLQLQRELDGEPDHVSRPGLAALAMRVGDSNVMVFPLAPRPRGPFDGEDGLDGGDAA